jgi:hypothetical protein
MHYPPKSDLSELISNLLTMNNFSSSKVQKKSLLAIKSIALLSFGFILANCFI